MLSVRRTAPKSFLGVFLRRVTVSSHKKPFWKILKKSVYIAFGLYCLKARPMPSSAPLRQLPFARLRAVLISSLSFWGHLHESVSQRAPAVRRNQRAPFKFCWDAQKRTTFNEMLPLFCLKQRIFSGLYREYLLFEMKFCGSYTLSSVSHLCVCVCALS